MQLNVHGHPLSRTQTGMGVLTKTLLVMKLASLLLFSFVLQVNARTMGQTVTWSGSKVPLQVVFAAIKEQTSITFFYDKADLALAHPVSLQVKNATLAAVLEEIMKDQPLDYEWLGKNSFYYPQGGGCTHKGHPHHCVLPAAGCPLCPFPGCQYQF